MSAGQRMQANVATPGAPEHQVPHIWSAHCDWEPACEPVDGSGGVLDRIAREVEAEAITASIALVRKHVAYGLSVNDGEEDYAFKVGALAATLRIVDDALAALVARIEG